MLSLDVRTNLILANMKGFSNGPFLNKGKIEKSGQDNVESLRIKTPSLDEVTALYCLLIFEIHCTPAASTWAPRSRSTMS